LHSSNTPNSANIVLIPDGSAVWKIREWRKSTAAKEKAFDSR